MKRGGPLQRKTPMSRGSGFKIKAANDNKPRKLPKNTGTGKKRPGANQWMLDACRGQPCYLNVPGVCRGEIETVVPCHSNWADMGGKGLGLKAADQFTVPGCWRCHSWLDQGPASRDEKRDVFKTAYSRWAAYRDAPANDNAGKPQKESM